MSLLRIEQEPETRLSVYERALELLSEQYRTGKPLPYAGKNDRLGLCILFPCILWDLNHYLDLGPDEENWNYHDTPMAFPELAKYLPLIEKMEPGTEKNNCRLEYLKKMIEDVKLELEAKYDTA